MPEPIWIDRSEQLPSLARTLESHASIGLDTEFLRERTFFPKLCLLQLAAGDAIWCVDTLRVGSLEPLGQCAHRRRDRAQGHPLGAAGSGGVLSQRQARDFAGIRHANRRRVRRAQAADRLRGARQDAA